MKALDKRYTNSKANRTIKQKTNTKNNIEAKNKTEIYAKPIQSEPEKPMCNNLISFDKSQKRNIIIKNESPIFPKRMLPIVENDTNDKQESKKFHNNQQKSYGASNTKTRNYAHDYILKYNSQIKSYNHSDLYCEHNKNIHNNLFRNYHNETKDISEKSIISITGSHRKQVQSAV